MIHGFVAPGFEEVKAEFARNFAERGELGAACAAYWRGSKVVDLWGGYQDTLGQLPWEEDTLVPVFSTTKGLAGMTIAVAHSRGLIDFDALVATYWPEFAQAGKARVTVRQLLAHQAGLCALDTPLDARTLGDPKTLAAILARQRPAWLPGTRHGYHGISLGWYEGELIRRVDPLVRSLGQFFQDEIARPLGLEFYIGLPSEVPKSRIALVKDFRPIQMLFHLNKLPRRFVLALMNPWSLTSRSLLNPRLSRPGDMVRGEFLSVEIPAGNGIGQVRSIAKAYSVFATGGRELGLRRETLDALETPAATPRNGLMDQVLRIEMSFSLGYMKPFPGFRFASSDRAFGTPGMGGSFGFADPDEQVGFAYAPNRSGFHLWDDPREMALRKAFYRCLAGTEPARAAGVPNRPLSR
jgi:CubicO group peptidase (beta-lactamase class C family)